MRGQLHVGGQQSKGHFNSNLLGPIPSLLHKQANNNSISQSRPNKGSTSGVIKEKMVGQSFNYYKAPKKKAQQMMKATKPTINQVWTAKGPLQDLRLNPNIAIPSSSSTFCQQTQSIVPFSEAVTHATPVTHSKADDESENFLSNLWGLSQQMGWSDVASTALVRSETDSYTESLSLPWHDGEQLELQGFQQGIQQPTAVETSKWIKLVLG